MKIIREPLMDLQITSNDWMMCIGIGVVMWVFGLVVFGFTRDKLAALV
jgi:ABC-type polysaccharide/polyol phosphate export permease